MQGCSGDSALATSTSAVPQPGVVYFIDDHLGNTHLVTDSLGNVLHEESRYPYGVQRQVKGEGSMAKGESTADYVYTGKEYDEETGLIYFGGRYYAPELGRWITPDPLLVEKDPKKSIDVPEELNLYAYVRNNPMRFVDEHGYIIKFEPGVSPEFKEAFEQAVGYLREAKVAKAIDELNDRREVVWISEITTDEVQFDPSDRRHVRIDWNPTVGLDVRRWPQSTMYDTNSRGCGIQTPALGLLHEAAHALGYFKGIFTAATEERVTGDLYGNREERRVITQIETPAARILDEPLRYYHGGTPVRVHCPTCTNWAPYNAR